MVNNCEFCGKAFSATNPRTFVQNHTVCKSCRATIEKFGSLDAAIKGIEEEKKRKEEEAQRKKEQEFLEKERKRIEAEERRARAAKNPEGIIYSLVGSRGKSMDVYKDKCVITTEVSLGSVATGNATDGEKTIYYIDVIGLQWKKSGLLLGYVQLETASGQMNNGNSNFWGENSFVFSTAETLITDELMEEVVDYIKMRIETFKQARMNQLFTPTVSPADEILKYKNLLDIGAITPEEYAAKKKQLLNLSGSESVSAETIKNLSNEDFPSPDEIPDL